MERKVRFLGGVAGVVFALAGANSEAAQVGSVQAEQEIREGVGGFGGDLISSDRFGNSTCSLGDLDGDGVVDLAVGAPSSNFGGTEQGTVWILFLNADGTVRSEQEIGAGVGGFGGALDPNDNFGRSVSALGDLDGDGIIELAVGASRDDDGGSAQGAVWILFLDADGTVQSQVKISETVGGLGSVLDPNDLFGASSTSLGDLDGDGVVDLVVGAEGDGDGGFEKGALWILFLNADGTVKAKQKISGQVGGFGTGLNAGDHFGASVASLGDLDGDGVVDLAVGAPLTNGDDDATSDEGALWIVFLNANGTVKAKQKIKDGVGGFGQGLAPNENFGSSVGALGDLDRDGVVDLAVGAPGPFSMKGALWILFLHSNGTVRSKQKIDEDEGGFGGVLGFNPAFGSAVASLGDLDGDGTVDVAVGAAEPGGDTGCVWVLFLEGDTTPPTLFHPPSVVVIDGFGPYGKVANFSVTATDDRDFAPDVVCVPPSGSVFPHGTTLVTCTATDASGNQAVQMFPVVVLLKGKHDPAKDLD